MAQAFPPVWLQRGPAVRVHRLESLCHQTNMPQTLTELEQWILLAILRLGDGAYAVTIREEITARTRTFVLRGSVYVTLDRLEARGFVEARLSDPLPERGGKARRYFRVCPAALRALRESRAAFVRMWQGVEGMVRKP